MAQSESAMIRVALPTTVEAKGSATGEDAHNHAREYLTELGGGWTEYSARGGWRNDEGELIRERVTMYESVLDTEESEFAATHARVLAEELAYITTEDTVMWQVIPMSHGFED